ncbi:nuclear transport factor 2 family protein [Schaalia naturae]
MREPTSAVRMLSDEEREIRRGAGVASEVARTLALLKLGFDTRCRGSVDDLVVPDAVFDESAMPGDVLNREEYFEIARTRARGRLLAQHSLSDTWVAGHTADGVRALTQFSGRFVAEESEDPALDGELVQTGSEGLYVDDLRWENGLWRLVRRRVFLQIREPVFRSFDISELTRLRRGRVMVDGVSDEAGPGPWSESADMRGSGGACDEIVECLYEIDHCLSLFWWDRLAEMCGTELARSVNERFRELGVVSCQASSSPLDLQVDAGNARARSAYELRLVCEPVGERPLDVLVGGVREDRFARQEDACWRLVERAENESIRLTAPTASSEEDRTAMRVTRTRVRELVEGVHRSGVEDRMMAMPGGDAHHGIDRQALIGVIRAELGSFLPSTAPMGIANCLIWPGSSQPPRCSQQTASTSPPRIYVQFWALTGEGPAGEVRSLRRITGCASVALRLVGAAWTPVACRVGLASLSRRGAAD